MDTQIILTVLQMILAFGNICIMAYAFSRFLASPHDTLEQRLNNLEEKIEDIEDSLKQGNERFNDLKNANTLIVTSIIALIEFEVDYCTHHGDEKISDDLKAAKDKLYNFLTER